MNLPSGRINPGFETAGGDGSSWPLEDISHVQTSPPLQQLQCPPDAEARHMGQEHVCVTERFAAIGRR
jgi:hypothetical protein